MENLSIVLAILYKLIESGESFTLIDHTLDVIHCIIDAGITASDKEQPVI